MKKIIKMLLIAFIFLLAFAYISNIYATTAVNMDLTGINDSSTYGAASNNTDRTISNTSTTRGSSTTISNATESNLDALTVSDMINIVLCAIGVILILLGIAIIIRQKTA